MKKSSVVLLFALALGLSIAACGSTPAAPSTVSTVTVSGGAPAVGATSQFTAIATLSGGATEDVSSSATWSSSNTAVATVSASGLVTSVRSGTAVISATFPASWDRTRSASPDPSLSHRIIAGYGRPAAIAAFASASSPATAASARPGRLARTPR